MQHRAEILALVQRAATLNEVRQFFKMNYGYGEKAVDVILENNGIEWPKSHIEWSAEERKAYLQELSSSDLDSLGTDRGQTTGWGV